MKKRAAALFLSALVMILGAGCGRDSASDSKNAGTNVGETTTVPIYTEYIPPTTVYKLPPQICSSKAAGVYCVETGEMIFGYNEHTPIAPASLTKMLTASTAINYVPLKTVFSVGSELQLVNPDSSLSMIGWGQQISLRGLLQGLLMASGNDAAYTIAASTARYFSGDGTMTDRQSVDFFCSLMNNFAGSLGMTESHFSNPDGWDDDSQYTTVNDLVKLAVHCLKKPELMEIMGTYSTVCNIESGGTAEWKNSNALIDPSSQFYVAEAVGMKTGTTIKAGNSLVAAFKNGGNTYITVVSGCNSDEERYIASIELYKYAVT